MPARWRDASPASAPRDAATAETQPAEPARSISRTAIVHSEAVRDRSKGEVHVPSAVALNRCAGTSAERWSASDGTPSIFSTSGRGGSARIASPVAERDAIPRMRDQGPEISHSPAIFSQARGSPTPKSAAFPAGREREPRRRSVSSSIDASPSPRNSAFPASRRNESTRTSRPPETDPPASSDIGNRSAGPLPPGEEIRSMPPGSAIDTVPSRRSAVPATRTEASPVPASEAGTPRAFQGIAARETRRRDAFPSACPESVRYSPSASSTPPHSLARARARRRTRPRRVSWASPSAPAAPGTPAFRKARRAAPSGSLHGPSAVTENSAFPSRTTRRTYETPGAPAAIHPAISSSPDTFADTVRFRVSIEPERRSAAESRAALNFLTRRTPSL